MRKKIIPVLAVLILIFVMLLVAFVGKKVKQYLPGKEEQDLTEYFGIEQEGEIPIELNRALTEEKAMEKDGTVYLNFEFVHDVLNDRFYWDANENVLLYTTAANVIKAYADSKDFFMGKAKDSKQYKIVLIDADQAYVALDFVAEYTNLTYERFENPDRILLQSEWGTVTNVKIKRDTQLRVKGGIKSKILKELEKGDVVIKLEAMEEWTKVATKDGLIGFVRNKRLGEETEETESHSFAEESFQHLTKDTQINMAWHQVTTAEGNGNIANVLQNTKGINVISPTWFYLNDNEGNIANIGSTDYVKYCHENGIEVWGLVSNLVNKDVSTAEILTHTSKRENLTNQILAAAIQYDLDGINVDLEELDATVGEGFIQFIRELSLKCEGNGIVLSVDNYVPSGYTKFYDREEQAVFADYLVIMAYDEHYAGSDEGSVSSIGFVRDAADAMIEEEHVPAGQVILGLPFYTRVWAETPKDTDGADVEAASEDYVPYELSSEAVSMDEAERRMTANGAEKTWLADMGQYYTQYENGGVTYKIWLEDATSLEEKLKVMEEHGFAGASFWKLGLENVSVWDTVIKYIN